MSTTTTGPKRDVIDIVVGFARTLRHAGVPASPDRVHAMIEALGHFNVLVPADVYWAGRLTLCGDPADLDRYDAAFRAYFHDQDYAEPARRARVRQLGAARLEIGTSPDRQDAMRYGDNATLAVRASSHEVLRHRDVASLTGEERAELRRLFGLLAPRAGGRRTRRHHPAPRGRVDLPRTVRHMLREGGEPAELLHRARRRKPRRLVLLVDVSGSMAPYADMLLRFAHAATRAQPTTTEVFTLGTRLTRITRELRQRDPDLALGSAGHTIPDWSGGTRLGQALKAFLDRWGQRGTARGAVVVLCSDGWERGDPSLLGTQLARLGRLAHTVVWANPHKGKDGFAPVTGGMLAALPYLDHLVAGHSFESLQRLTEVIADA